ncbi:alpha/beta fold hydrolase [Chryseolinea soli]|uniref:Alpha/beta hydrolase n=1 Tax=Chryseolinea soli TaxID=2321403 RepID=A0A385STQ9_9BACT|nr:alpha/beta hydrolase [Chryseolinea soli]AYB34589.1 alpha/beta hydrolase [Chryseolinea soli]
MKEEKAVNVGPAKIEMVYQRFGDTASPPVLLIVGGQMYRWPDGFCTELVQRGLQIIRFDSRDCGLSTHFHSAPEPDFAAAMKGDYASVSYTLSDMAADTIGLMDALGFKSAHVVGVSLGGMIAQTMAIEYPERIRSLTSMMSTTGNSSVGQPDWSALAHLGASPGDKQGFIEWQVKAFKAVGSPKYPLDEAKAAENAGRAWDRDHDRLGSLRQKIAVLKSGDRTEKLRRLHVPALVIHGDSDKMLHVSGGKATAEAIPGAELVIFEGVGHGFPPALWSAFSDRIANLVRKAEATQPR